MDFGTLDYTQIGGVVIATNNVDASYIGTLDAVTYDIEVYLGDGPPQRVNGVALQGRVSTPTSVGAETIDIQAAKPGAPIWGHIMNGQLSFEVREWPALGPC